MIDSINLNPTFDNKPPITTAQANLSPNWVGDGSMSKELKEITTLYNIAVAVGSSLNLREIIRTLYKEVGRLIDTTNFAIVLYDAPASQLNFVLVFDQGQQRKPFSRKYNNSQGAIAHVLESETPLLVPDFLEADETLRAGQLHADGAVRAWLGVPIFNPALSQERPQGVIATWSYTPHHFTEHDLWLLSAIGTQTAIAIRNAQRYELSQRRATEMANLKDIAQRRVTEMALLNDITRTLSATLQFDEVLMRIMDRVEGILKAEAGWLLLIEPTSGDLIFQIGLGRARQTQPFALLRGRGLAGDVVMTGQPVLVADISKAQRHFIELAGRVDFPVHSILGVPLILDNQVIGVLEMMSKKGDTFTANDLDLLSSIAPYAAIAIKNARFHENVMAERDRVIDAEEQARKALARDLHDGATQMVSAIMMRLDFCKLLVEREPEKLLPELNLTQDLARQAIFQIRTLLFELRPLTLEAQGLVPALQVFSERRQKDIEETTQLRVKVKTIKPDEKISRQDDKVEGAIFAIVQEGVNNAIKHAQSTSIVVAIEETFTSIYITLTDNGIGFDVDEVMSDYEKRGSLGMLNIRERAELIGSELEFNSIIDQGTRISLRVPKAKAERLKKRGTGPLTLPLNMLRDESETLKKD